MAYELWYIDGINLTSAYGIYVSKGTADLLRMAPKKEGISHDWREVNGKEYDLDRIVLDERVTTLQIGMLAASEAVFWQQLDAFKALLTKPGLRRLEIATHPGKQYYFFYREMSSVTQLQALTGKGGEVAQLFSLTIVEPTPNPAPEQTQALSDEAGSIIIV